MSTKIKICGLRREADMYYANLVRPDYVGFVFAHSRRRVVPKRAAKLREILDGSIPAVGVFVNASIKEILSIASHGVIQMIQLHGQEDEEYIRLLKEKTDLPLIKAVRAENREMVCSALTMDVDYFLFDQGNGGTGKTFEWSILPDEMEKPYFLAGGIGPHNVEMAVKQLNPYAVDVSSGVETDGVKDYEKMVDLVRRIRNE